MSPAHAGAMGAISVKVGSIAEMEEALSKRHGVTDRPYVIVIDTDPYPHTPSGGSWWEVGVPEVSDRESVREARATFEAGKKAQRVL